MNIEFQKRGELHSSTAIISNGQSYTYDQLYAKSDNIAIQLLGHETDLEEARVAYMIDPSFAYTATQWGIWKAGGIAVPLCVLHPLPSVEYVIKDTQCKKIIIGRKYEEFLRPLLKAQDLDVLIYEDIRGKARLISIDISENRRAMILYTSGTTNLPKGVVSTHANIKSQITTLVDAWEWSSEDHILNILPLHHVHGIINVMSCALWSGATCEFLPKFDAQQVWDLLAGGSINVFMAVPTIYYKLIAHWETQDHDTQSRWSTACKNFRLMVSGSAALPISVLEQWEDITGQRLLERYGMTEIGMGLSNPYRGERRAGHVGHPLPGVEIRLVNESNRSINAEDPGEIQVKGPNVFKEYWQKLQATQDAFTTDGWFRTGDVALLSEGYYKILGRTSVDIIKSGGYKISALEIEEVIRKYPGVKDCGVVGIEDDEWGEVVAVALVVREEGIETDAIKSWLKDQMPPYRIPRKYIFLEDLPRNTLGKVTKKELKNMF